MRERDIFLGAIDLSDEARAEYLDAACGDDAGLRGRVVALLRSHEHAGSFLNVPVASPASDTPLTRAFRAADADPVDALPHGPSAGADDLDLTRGFLAPSKRPDALGRIGHYEVLEVLGRGGFGIVFRAFDETLQRVVAVKVLAPSMAATSPARKRFLREARSAAAIRHEYVVQVYAVEEQPLPHIAMEFVPGESLQQRLDRTGPLDRAEVLRIGRQVAEGLAAAHATGVVHRDIKPANVLVEPGTLRVRITDFGLARAADDASLTRSGTVAGTPLYMAPEQARAESLDHRADLFSLGSVLYTLLTGHPPFRAESTLGVLKRVADDTPRPIREVIPEVPEWFCRIVATLHAKNPADRFQSAREVADVLADYERQLAVHNELRDASRIPCGKPVPAPPARRDREWPYLLLWVMFPLSVGVISFFLPSDPWYRVMAWGTIPFVAVAFVIYRWPGCYARRRRGRDRLRRCRWPARTARVGRGMGGSCGSRRGRSEGWWSRPSPSGSARRRPSTHPTRARWSSRSRWAGSR